MMGRSMLSFLVVSWALVGQAHASANELGYAGRLLGASGAPVADGLYSMTFRLFAGATGGSAFFEQDGDAVAQDVSDASLVNVTAGYFFVLLQHAELPQLLAQYKAAHLEIEVEGELLTPRQPLTAAPWVVAREWGTADWQAGMGGEDGVANWGTGDWTVRYAVGGYVTSCHGQTKQQCAAVVAIDAVGREGAVPDEQWTYGVLAQSHSEHGFGIYSEAYGASGHGVRAIAHADGNTRAISAKNVGDWIEDTDGPNHQLPMALLAETTGAYARTITAHAYGENNIGVRAAATQANSRGVWGSASGVNSIGVFGEATHDAKRGVWGAANAPDGIGVLGSSSGDNAVGVSAHVTGTGGVAVHARATNSATTALQVEGVLEMNGKRRFPVAYMGRASRTGANTTGPCDLTPAMEGLTCAFTTGAPLRFQINSANSDEFTGCVTVVSAQFGTPTVVSQLTQSDNIQIYMDSAASGTKVVTFLVSCP